ncbi:MAG: fucose isomerase [Candidatus Thorarchaeota archaeon]
MTINIIPFFSSVSPEGLSKEILNELEQDGVNFLRTDSEHTLGKPTYLFIGTGGTENDVVKFLEETDLSSPIILLSYDERNSLPAAMEIRSYLQKKGIDTRIVHMQLPKLHALLGRWSKYHGIVEFLKGAKLGVIGEPSSWLIASHVNPQRVRTRWGIEIEDIPIDALTKKLPYEISKEFLGHVDTFKSKATCQNVSDDEIEKAGIVAQRLSELTKSEKLTAVTVQCFSLLQDTGISGCYSLSFLNDTENFVAGCEGDIPATFTMLLARLLTGSPSFMANVASVDQELNTAVFAHCTISTSITDNYEITNHFETGLSIGVRGKLPLTEVTVLKVFGEDLNEYWVSGGTIIDNLVNDKVCRTQIRVAMDEPVDYFLEESLANHHIIIPGDHVQEIIEFFDFIERE